MTNHDVNKKYLYICKENMYEHTKHRPT